MSRPAPCVDMSKTKTVRLRTALDCLPEQYQQRSKRVRITFRSTPGERRVLRKKKFIPPSEWAEKYRFMTYGPLEGSRWDNSFMPHMRGIMDASFFPSVVYIGNCKAPQTGSSAGLETMMAYIADMQPGPAFVVYPDRDTASKRSTDYLQPIFKKSPQLRKLLTGSSDDMASLRIKLQTMLIYMGWAGSVTSLGNISARYLFGDEVDKWVEQASKKEARTVDLFHERFSSYLYGQKCWKISTPTVVTGVIWKFMMEEAQVVFDYQIRCPECGELFCMDGKHLRVIEDTRDPLRVEGEDLARYVTPCCGIMMDDRQRRKQLQDGVWFSREKVAADGTVVQPSLELFAYLKKYRPEKICFHSPRWVSTRSKNSQMLAAFFKGLKDVKAMQYYDNQIAAVAHVSAKLSRKEDQIFRLRDDRPAGLVPGRGRVAALVAGVDTQTDHFVYSIRAFGWGLEQPSWQVRNGIVDTREGLIKILFEDQYRDSDGLYYPVHLAVIDTGGDRTSEIYDFCVSADGLGRLQAYKGASGRKAQPHRFTTIDTYPGTNRAIPGGVRLAVCDTHHYKDTLARKLRTEPDAPGAYLFHSEITEAFAAEMCAEVADERGLWGNPKEQANHGWDCSVMELVGADILQIKFWQQDGEEE